MWYNFEENFVIIKYGKIFTHTSFSTNLKNDILETSSLK